MKKLRDIGRCVGRAKEDRTKELEKENKTLNAEIHALKLVNWYHSIKESTTIPIHDFPYVTTGIQLNKINEEHQELLDAYLYDSDDRAIEEATDLIQATFNLIEMLSPNGVHEALQKHSEKMAARGYKVKYELSIGK